MRLIVLAVWLVGAAVAADDFSPMVTSEPPKCEKATRTLFWPEEANSDARAALRLAREGKLLICTRSTWKYGWRPVAVNLRVAEEERAKGRR
jgi:hypothetical protein